MQIKNMAYLLLATLILLVSCTKIETQGIPIGERELPDMVMENAVYVIGQGSEKPLSISAQKITAYKSEKGTIIENAQLEREDFTGQCDKLTINSASNYAVLTGNVIIHQKSDDITIMAQNIVWDQKKDSLFSDGEVELFYEEGTSLRAIGFYSILNENSFEFSQVLEGRITE